MEEKKFLEFTVQLRKPYNHLANLFAYPDFYKEYHCFFMSLEKQNLLALSCFRCKTSFASLTIKFMTKDFEPYNYDSLTKFNLASVHNCKVKFTVEPVFNENPKKSIGPILRVEVFHPRDEKHKKELLENLNLVL